MNKNTSQHFHFFEVDNQSNQTLFLLHGTGGDEHDLLPLVESLAPDFNFVGLRGNVVEHDQARFFNRLALGIFDQDSIQHEVKKLAEFMAEWQSERNLTANRIAFLGYSNGANMILATLFLWPQLVSRAVLLHPMLPFEPAALPLKSKDFLVSYGARDPMVSPSDSQKVVTVLERNGARVTVVPHAGGHEIQSVEVAALTDFLSRVKS